MFSEYHDRRCIYDILKPCGRNTTKMTVKVLSYEDLVTLKQIFVTFPILNATTRSMMQKIKETQGFWRTQVTENKSIPIFFYLSVSHNTPLKMLQRRDPKTWPTFWCFGSILCNLKNLGWGGESRQVVWRTRDRADSTGRGGPGHLWGTGGTQGSWGWRGGGDTFARARPVEGG